MTVFRLLEKNNLTLWKCDLDYTGFVQTLMPVEFFERKRQDLDTSHKCVQCSGENTLCISLLTLQKEFSSVLVKPH